LNNVLADPTLELHDANGATLVANDNWTDDPISAALLTSNGLALTDPKESGIFTALPAGQFTHHRARESSLYGFRVVAEPDETWFLASSDGGCVGEIDHERLVDRQTTLLSRSSAALTDRGPV